MEETMARPRYVRRAAPGRRYRKTARENGRLTRTIARQLLIALILLVVAGIIKSVNTPATNFMSEKVRFALQQNIDLKSVYDYMDKAVASMKNSMAPNKKEAAQSGNEGAGAGPGPEAGTVTGPGTGTGSGTATDPGTRTGPGTGTGSGTATDPGTRTGPGTGIGSGTVTGSGTTTGPGTATDSGTGTGSGIVTNSGTATGSETGAHTGSPGAVADKASGEGNTAGGDNTIRPESSVLAATYEMDAKASAGMQIPVSGVLSSRFGPRTDPFTGKVKLHEGVDIEAARGAAVKAVLGGFVEDAGSSPSYGNYLKLEHQDGLETVYAHCSSLEVKKGAAVKQGEVIARVGDSGASVGVHLHFEVLRDGKPVDPLDYLSFDAR